MKDLKYLIIDEMSMLSLVNMFWLDIRLKEATGKKDTLFGGVSVIMLGDFAQLPPVGGKSLWHRGALATEPKKRDKQLKGQMNYLK